MRDITKEGFNANEPVRNYVKLSERIEELVKRQREIEELVIEFAVRLTKVEQ
ncbi:MAG: hypothetical protein V1847_01595 [Candidatus Diapherotrites archaeon]